MPLPVPNALIQCVYYKDHWRAFASGLCNGSKYQSFPLRLKRSFFYHVMVLYRIQDPPANCRLIVDEMVCERCEKKSRPEH